MKKLMTLLACVAYVSAGSAAEQDYHKDYDACVKEQGRMNTSVVFYCAEKVSALVEREIQSRYREVHRRLQQESPESAKQFADAHKNWQRYRDLSCELKGRHVGTPMLAYCPMQMNIARAQVLQEF